MPTDSVFRRLPEPGRPRLTISVDGRPVEARTGDTVAAALLGAGIVETRRTPVGDVARGPFCMMGACFDCLMEIDGVPNRQACMVEARDGMVIRSMAGARRAAQCGRDD